MFISHQLKGDTCLDEGFKEAFIYMRQEGLIQNGDIYLEGSIFKSEGGIRPDVVFIPILWKNWEKALTLHLVQPLMSSAFCNNSASNKWASEMLIEMP